MCGYFVVGVEGFLKWMNFGILMCLVYVFGVNFFFMVDLDQKICKVLFLDIFKSFGYLFIFMWDSVDIMDLLCGCQLVGIELMDELIDLFSFGYFLQVVYVLGFECGFLLLQMLECCDYVVKILIKFCINVVMVGVIVMYDCYCVMGCYVECLVMVGGFKIVWLKYVSGGLVSWIGCKVLGN